MLTSRTTSLWVFSFICLLVFWCQLVSTSWLCVRANDVSVCFADVQQAETCGEITSRSSLDQLSSTRSRFWSKGSSLFVCLFKLGLFIYMFSVGGLIKFSLPKNSLFFRHISPETVLCLESCHHSEPKHERVLAPSSGSCDFFLRILIFTLISQNVDTPTFFF